MAKTVSTTLIVKSSAFKNNEMIPSQYTCNGLNINPELIIEELPANTKSLAIIVDDADASSGIYCHWLVWDILPERIVEEDSVPGIQGRNTMGENRYTGPCPPSGTHHYHFKVYALDSKLSALPPSTNEKELTAAMKPHIISSGELIGLYKK
ncbi:YbhB/YbcL family Raf kinase inhibitor-like protein [Flavobacterium frigoris]|nr:YbhB/YbcL family Raf kinase inhibitor-like protein [Flavobacterium frigoris]